MTEDRNRKQTRLASIVILVAMILWMGVSWLGGQMGWPVRYAFLADIATLGALIWALVVLIQVWRKRQRDEG
ncbi:MAG: DUF5337 domain-containing protein [Alphaproteobacteria bacterium]|nr:DUF5337 domain-containing protein [Alphaproteobacteria bacterium]